MATGATLSPQEILRRAAARRQSERRWQRRIRVGCLPALLIFTCVLLSFLNTVPFVDVPSGIVDLNSFLIGGRIAISLQALFLLQLMGTWALGLVGAVVATRAAAGQGRFVAERLAILRNRASFLAWAVLALRLLFLAVVIMTLAFLYTPVLGTRLDSDLASSIWLAIQLEPLEIGVVLFVMLVSWLFGPFLRLRYSMALGALAATWSRRSDSRFWLAISARLAAGLLGMLLVLWGGALLNLISYALQNPNVGQGIPYNLPPVIASLSPLAQGTASWLAIAALLALYVAGQVFLPPLAIALARLRLARLGHGPDKPFAEVYSQAHEAQSQEAASLAETSPESS